MDIRKLLLVLSLPLLLTACEQETTIPVAPDSAAIAANNRAVGLMGKFEYEPARAGFAQIVDAWPDWHDARVNLAIATLNRQWDGDEEQALAIAESVLADDPSNLRARYLAGLVQLYLGDPASARENFRQVFEADATDAYAAYYLAQCNAQLGEYESALPLFRRAMELNPYLRSAYYGAFQSLQRLGMTAEAEALAADYQRLENNPRSLLAEFKYTRMGPKGSALAVGRDEAMSAPQPKGELFEEPLLHAVDQYTASDGRMPAITAADMQGNGLSDLLLTGANSGSLVLTGTEDGGFITEEDHPLGGIGDVNAALWGDFDNDGLTDVYICRTGPNQLWRQTATGQWTDVTASTLTAGGELDTVDGAFFDADHDGDLDLFLVNADGPNELLNNNLDGSFRPLAASQGLAGNGTPSRSVVPVDIDSDRDVDIVVLNQQPPHEVYLNDRLWSYRQAEGFEAFSDSPVLAAVAADADANGQTELYTATPGGELHRWQPDDSGSWTARALAAPAMLQGANRAQLAAFDVDGSGAPELIVSTAGGWSVISLAGSDHQAIFDATAAEDEMLTILPFVGGSTNGPGLLALQAGGGLAYWRPGPGRHAFVTLTLSGRQDDAQSMRSNASGIGARVAVRTGSRWSLVQGFRNHSGPGQSLQPLPIGLGGALQADFVAIDWSDGVFQSEIDVAASEVRHIVETQRQLSSCPVLFAWNGEAHVFVSDFLGVGGMGYAVAPGEYNTPRPWENFLMPRGFLQPRDGRYEIKIGEPMEEIAYIDAVRLAVYDLPPGWQMVMDDRMGISPPYPTGEPRFFREDMVAVYAENDRGEDVTASLSEADNKAAPVGDLDIRFIGLLVDEHVLTLSFDQPVDGQSGSPMLLIDGWVEYPYSQTNFAAWQAGATYQAPTLEAWADGEWQVVAATFGYPAGMPRRMSFPLDNLPAGADRLRLRTNQQIYFDRIAVAWAEDLPDHQKTLLPLAAARVSKPGFARRSTYDQHRPFYDYATLDPFWDTRYMSGFYTRFGPAYELVAEQDDAVAVIGPGEELHLEFQAGTQAPDGWRRYHVLESNGWAKDMDLFTRDGDTVEPMPSSGKPAALRDELHARYNTRYRSGR